MSTAAIAIIIRRERDLAEHFVAQRATSIANAQSLQQLGVEHDRIFRRLEDRAVIRAGAPGTYYLDEPSWNAMNSTRRRVLMIVVLVGLVLLALAIGTSSKARNSDSPRAEQQTP